MLLTLTAYGGRGATVLEQAIFYEECGAPCGPAHLYEGHVQGAADGVIGRHGIRNPAATGTGGRGEGSVCRLIVAPRGHPGARRRALAHAEEAG